MIKRRIKVKEYGKTIFSGLGTWKAELEYDLQGNGIWRSEDEIYAFGMTKEEALNNLKDHILNEIRSLTIALEEAK